MVQTEEQADVYGFPLEGLTPQQRADRAACAAYEARRRAKWQVFVERQELPTGAVLKRYCRKGIPHELRGWVWWHVSGAGEAAAAEPGHYAACLQAGSSRAAVKQIELDLPRTFPRHAWLAGEEGQAALRAVLTAYAGHNPDVGYCQGMNFLVGLLLLAVEQDCERCFWLLLVLLEKVLYPGTFAPNLDGCHVEMGCLGALLAQKQPRLAGHLNACGCEPSLLTTDWYLCLFATSLPPETAARVWDALFSEGRKVLHRMGLALLSMVGPRLLKLDNPGEILHCLKSCAGGVHARDALMDTAFKGIGGLPGAKVAKLQAAEAHKVAAMLSARDAVRRRTSLKQSIAAGQAIQQQQEQQPAAPAANGAGTSSSNSSSQGQQQQPSLLDQGPAVKGAASGLSVRASPSFKASVAG